MINNRIAGPINGYYVSVGSLTLGEMGRRHLGISRVYDHEPTGHYDGLSVTELENLEPLTSRANALDEAMQNGIALALSLGRGPCRPETSKNELRCIAYTSHARDDLTRIDLHRIVSTSRGRNADLSITGHLLMIDDRFLQYIEGPQAHIELVYYLIRRDRRHSGIIELIREPIEARAYSGWTLAFEHMDDWAPVHEGPSLMNRTDHKAAIEATFGFFSRTLNLPRGDAGS